MISGKQLRTLIRAVKGRSLKAVEGAAPGAFPWHIRGARITTRRMPLETYNVYGEFKVKTPGGTAGHVSATYYPGSQRAHISGVFAEMMNQPLQLGAMGYRKLFRGIKSALGVTPNTRVSFSRVPNDFAPATKGDRPLRGRRWGREEVRTR